MRGHVQVHTRSGRMIASDSEEVTQEQVDQTMDYFKELFKSNNQKAYVEVEGGGRKAILPISSVDYIEFVKDF